MNTKDIKPVSVECKASLDMNIQARTNTQGANDALRIFAGEVGKGFKGLLWALGFTAACFGLSLLKWW
ncbi:MAG: hypothetical protein Q4A62_03360 [Eikenella sp.]|nr:hypothetical protein [Eikenella sp.]